MKDLTQEFLKLHVIATAVEILDKVCAERAAAVWALQLRQPRPCMVFAPSRTENQLSQIACSFLVDSLEALGSTCTLVAQGLDRRCTLVYKSLAAAQPVPHRTSK